MTSEGGKNRGNLSIADGGMPSTKADVELERAARALFIAMCGKDGKSISKNFRNVARGHTSPLRMVVRRFKEAKAARSPKAYTHSKDVVRALDRYVDTLHGVPPAA
jgi:hypothetical protein